MHARRIACRRLIKDAIANILLKIDSFSRSLSNFGRKGNHGWRGKAREGNVAGTMVMMTNAAMRKNTPFYVSIYVSIFLIHDTKY
jgi:hypothetical protein